MEINKTESTDIEDKIYLIRGEKVMLDWDLADLHGVSTMRLNEQVRRNVRRFPPDFMFQLSNQEFGALISQIAISKKGRGGRRKAPLVFTEQGVAMLSAVLHSERAIDVQFEVVFEAIRELMSVHSVPPKRIIALAPESDT